METWQKRYTLVVRNAARMASKYDLFRLTVFNESYKSSIDEKTWVAVGVTTGETTDEVECFIEKLTVEDPPAQFLLKYATQTLNDSVWKFEICLDHLSAKLEG